MKKRKVRDLIIAVVFFLAGFLMMSCGADVVMAKQNKPLKIWHENENGYCDTWNLIDEKTNVNYIVVTSFGPHGQSCTISPRFNADGSLYVNE